MCSGPTSSERARPVPPGASAERHSKLPMHAGREDRDRAAVAIERRIRDVLVIQRSMQVLREFAIVIHFKNSLPTVIQGAIAVEDSGPAGFQEFLVHA